MKKLKLFIIIVVVSILTITFGACSSTTPMQNIIGNSTPWVDKDNNITETAIYNVESTTGDVTTTGTYTMIVKKQLNNADFTIGKGELSYTLTNFSGYVASTTLQMDDGTISYNEVAFLTSFIVKASYIEKTSDGATSYTLAKYSDKDKCEVSNYTSNNTVISTNSITLQAFKSSPYFDNDMIYLLARSFATTSTSFSFNVTNLKGLNLTPVIMNRAASEKIDFVADNTNYAEDEKEEDKDKIDTNRYDIAINRSFPGTGTPIKCYISKLPINGRTLFDKEKNTDLSKFAINPIVKIVQNNTTLTLQSITLA